MIELKKSFKINMRFNLFHIVLLVCCITVSTEIFAQQGIGTDTPEKSAALEIKSSQRGLLIPRVELTAVDSYSPITGDQVNSLLVFNTNTENDNLSPGFYYWDTETWKRLNTEEEGVTLDPQDLVSSNETILVTNGEGATLEHVEIDINPGGIGQYLKTNDDGEVIWSELDQVEIPSANLEVEENVLEFLNGTDGIGKLLNTNARIGIVEQGVTPEKIAPGSEGQILKTNDEGEVNWEDLEEINLETGNLISDNPIITIENGEDAVFHETEIKLIPGENGEVLLTNENQVEWGVIDNLAIEPWMDQDNIGEKATENTQNIYQVGNVAVGKEEGFLGVALDVAGIIRGGDPATGGSFGENSIAVGNGVVASGNNSVAFGNLSEATAYGAFAGGGYTSTNPGSGDPSFSPGGIASGGASFAFGNQTEASGDYSVAMGRETLANKVGAVAMGRDTRAKGNYSFVTGRNNEVTAYYASAHGRYLHVNSSFSTAVGRGNVNFNGSLVSGWNAEDPLFVIGNGVNRSVDSTNNAMTVLKSGFVGIGLDGTGANAKPKERLDIGNGKVRVRDLPDTDGDIMEDKIVVVRTTTSNNQKGILRSINPSELKSTGPWFEQNTDIPATMNDQDIYQTGFVAINKDDYFLDAALDVEGAIRGGHQGQSGNTTIIGEYSIGVGEMVVANDKYTAAFGYKSEATGEGAFAGGGASAKPGGKASGLSSFAFGWGSEAQGGYSTAIGRKNKAFDDYAVAFGYDNQATGIYSFALGRDNSAENAGAVTFGRDNESKGNYSFTVGRYLIAPSSFSTSVGSGNAITSDEGPTEPIGEKNENPIFQIGNGSNSNRNNALTVLKNGKVGIGIIGTEGDAKPTEILDIGEASSSEKNKVRIRDLWNTSIGEEGYKFVVVNDQGILKINDEIEPLPYQSSEKIEKLYLNSIEQEEKIIALQTEINDLKKDKKKIEKRLERLEEILKER